MLLFLACSSPQLETGFVVFAPRTETLDVELGVNEEKRWLLEGFVNQIDNDDENLGIEILFGTSQADSQVDVTVFDGNSVEEIVFESRLNSEDGALFYQQVPCFQGCTFRFVTKAIHAGGQENSRLKLVFRLDQPDGELLISSLL